MVVIKTLFTLVRRKSGISLIEVIMTLVLTSIIMIALIAFISFTGTTTGIVMGRSQVQTQMRHIMQSINIELTAATGALIADGSIATGYTPAEGVVVFGFQNVGGERRFVMRGNHPLVEDRVFDLTDEHFDLTFERVGVGYYNLVRVSMEYDDGNERLWFEMTEDILLPNLNYSNQVRVYPDDLTIGSILAIGTLIEDTPGPPIFP